METGANEPAAAGGVSADDPALPAGSPEGSRKRQQESQRKQFLQRFAEAALSLSMLPRYRHMTLADLETVLTIPLMQGRVAIAYAGATALPADSTGAPAVAAGSTHTSALPAGSPEGSRTREQESLSGIAIWASVSAEVDAKIREQIKAQVFPIRLKPEDWTSGEIVWLLDVIAPSRELGTSVLANFKQVAKTARFNMHPVVSGSVDAEFLEQVKVGG